MKISQKYIFTLIIGLIALISCVSHKKKGESSRLSKFYHNTTAKYNGYFNANELLEETILRLNQNHKDNYAQLLPIFPYNAVENVDAEKSNLDKIIQKASIDITLHKKSRWADDCYLLLCKSQYLKKDYETAESSFKYVLDEFTPNNLFNKDKSKKTLIKDKKKTSEDKKKAEKKAKEAAKKKAQDKIKAREKAKKQALKDKKNHKTPKNPTETTETISEPLPSGDKKDKEPKLNNVGSKLFPHTPAFWEATIWAAKNLTERAKYYESEQILRSIAKDPNTPKSTYGDLYATLANNFVRQKKFDQAIEALILATQYTKSKKTKARYAYILGQLYQQNKRPIASDEYFTQCSKLRPSYDMNLHAKMNLLLNKAQSGTPLEDVISQLNKLKKDTKNADYVSEINFTIAQIYYKENKIPETIDYLNASLWDPSAKPNQKASSYLLLAEINFENQNYLKSKYYYDSTLQSLPKNDERKSLVSRMKNNLDDIAKQIEIITLQDSLIKIGSLSVKERRALAIQIKNEAKAKLVKPQIDRQAMEFNQFQPFGADGVNNKFDAFQDTRNGNAPNSGNPKASNFFAYDQRTLNRGRGEFEQNWGQRTLEDHWRRSNKTSFNFDVATTEETTEETKDSLEADLANILKDIPDDPKKLAEAHGKIQSAMFQLGVLYREKLENFQKSKTTHTDLLERYPKTERKPDVLYYLYLNCLDLNDPGCAASYNDQIIREFPETNYAKALGDTNYVKALSVSVDVISEGYQKAYQSYNNHQYEQAFTELQIIKTKMPPGHPLMPKVALLNAFCSVYNNQNKDVYINALKDVVAQFPGTPEEIKAKEMIRFLKGDQDAFITVTSQEIEKAQFKMEDDNVHYVFVLLFDPPAKQTDKAKIAISDYHQKYHKPENLKMSSLEFDVEKNTSLILIRKFDNRNQAMKYYNGVQRKPNEFIPNITNYEIFAVTQNNYREILRLKSVKEYQAYFNENYLNKKG